MGGAAWLTLGGGAWGDLSTELCPPTAYVGTSYFDVNAPSALCGCLRVATVPEDVATTCVVVVIAGMVAAVNASNGDVGRVAPGAAVRCSSLLILAWARCGFSFLFCRTAAVFPARCPRACVLGRTMLWTWNRWRLKLLLSLDLYPQNSTGHVRHWTPTLWMEAMCDGMWLRCLARYSHPTTGHVCHCTPMLCVLARWRVTELFLLELYPQSLTGQTWHGAFGDAAPDADDISPPPLPTSLCLSAAVPVSGAVFVSGAVSIVAFVDVFVDVC